MKKVLYGIGDRCIVNVRSVTRCFSVSKYQRRLCVSERTVQVVFSEKEPTVCFLESLYFFLSETPFVE